MKYSMKYLPMSNEIINHTAAMENEMLNEIFTIEQWNISRWAMKYSMKFAGILNETGPTLNENAFHSFVVAKQIFLWQLPQLHRCNWQLLVERWVRILVDYTLFFHCGNNLQKHDRGYKSCLNKRSVLSVQSLQPRPNERQLLRFVAADPLHRF